MTVAILFYGLLYEKIEVAISQVEKENKRKRQTKEFQFPSNQLIYYI